MALVLHRDSASGKNDGDKGSALAIYQPLTADDGFRLLELLPGSGNDPICCLLKHAVLSDAPEFEAMSYAWGDASDTLEIECEGVSFMVTRNLHALLSNIRHEDTARTLWVDAICIDQTNLAERSSQVQIMDRIYSTATLVLAWLGEAADGSDEAIEMIHTWRPLKWKSQPDRKLPVVTDPIWKKLHKLFHREYFRRMWVWRSLCKRHEAWNNESTDHPRGSSSTRVHHHVRQVLSHLAGHIEYSMVLDGDGPSHKRRTGRHESGRSHCRHTE
jgi:hypothetical protein